MANFKRANEAFCATPSALPKAPPIDLVVKRDDGVPTHSERRQACDVGDKNVSVLPNTPGRGVAGALSLPPPSLLGTATKRKAAPAPSPLVAVGAVVIICAAVVAWPGRERSDPPVRRRPIRRKGSVFRFH